ncbi:MAG: hypothetical protein A2Y10_05385 [Planctomycetes bacterium GWF2_41_51]|nr:MAG: hypothetical protein A2Y10_05385 [Planctomycetes bacterium GWF2_41_51]HBG26809.1 hypothetical protein [Phycisphaerales bacterium]
MSTGTPRLNITAGKLIITNTDSIGVANEINSFIQAGYLTFYNGDPLAEYSIIVNGSGFTEVTASSPENIFAFNPIPANLSTEIGLNPNLTWSAGAGAASHDVYFGNFNPGVFKCNQFTTNFIPIELLPNRTYYWRIDEKSASGTTTIGSVWQFTTIALPWSDNFNTVNFTAGGWITSGTGTALSTNAGYPSGYGARLRGSSGANSIRKNKSTEGYNSITLRYDRRLNSSTSVTLTVDWSADVGSNWNVLETIRAHPQHHGQTKPGLCLQVQITTQISASDSEQPQALRIMHT